MDFIRSQSTEMIISSAYDVRKLSHGFRDKGLGKLYMIVVSEDAWYTLRRRLCNYYEPQIEGEAGKLIVHSPYGDVSIVYGSWLKYSETELHGTPVNITFRHEVVGQFIDKPKKTKI